MIDPFAVPVMRLARYGLATTGELDDVLDMGRFEVLSDSLTITHKLHHSRSIRQGNDSVCPKAEAPRFRLAIAAENTVRHLEHLLHDRILSKFIVSFELQKSVNAACLIQVQ